MTRSLLIPHDWQFAIHESLGNFSEFDSVNWLAFLKDSGHFNNFEQMSNFIITAALIDSFDSELSSPELKKFIDSEPQKVSALYAEVRRLFTTLKSAPSSNQWETDGDLKQLQKTILWTLVSGLMNPNEIHRIEFSNQASRVVMARWREKFVINCEVQQDKDSGARTINQMAPWIGARDGNFTSFVTPKFCSASETFSLANFPNETTLNRRMAKFIQLFKSVGVMEIEVDVNGNSAWIVLLEFLRRFDFGLDMKVQFRRSNLP